LQGITVAVGYVVDIAVGYVLDICNEVKGIITMMMYNSNFG